MKKVFLVILAAMAVLSIGTISAFASGHLVGHNFVNKSDNMVCSYADLNGDGICDNCSAHYGCAIAGAICGRNFIDANGDGICDNYNAYNGQSCGGAGYGICGLNINRNGNRDNHAVSHSRKNGHGHNYKVGNGR